MEDKKFSKLLKEVREENECDVSYEIDDDPLTKEQTRELISAIGENTELEELSLRGLDLDTEAVNLLADVLRNNTTLTILDLRETNIGEDGAIAIADALIENDTLMNLNLSDNQIGDRGAEAIANALKINDGLMRIDLGDNNISDQGVSAFSDALHENRCLLQINLLGVTGVTQETAKEMAQALTAQKKILTFGISVTDIESAGILETSLDNLPNIDRATIKVDGYDEDIVFCNTKEEDNRYITMIGEYMEGKISEESLRADFNPHLIYIQTVPQKNPMNRRWINSLQFRDGNWYETSKPSTPSERIERIEDAILDLSRAPNLQTRTLGAMITSEGEQREDYVRDTAERMGGGTLEKIINHEGLDTYHFAIRFLRDVQLQQTVAAAFKGSVDGGPLSETGLSEKHTFHSQLSEQGGERLTEFKDQLARQLRRQGLRLTGDKNELLREALAAEMKSIFESEEIATEGGKQVKVTVKEHTDKQVADLVSKAREAAEGKWQAKVGGKSAPEKVEQRGASAVDALQKGKEREDGETQRGA